MVPALAWLIGPARKSWMGPTRLPGIACRIDDAPPLLFVAGQPGDSGETAAGDGRQPASRPGMDTAAVFPQPGEVLCFVITSGLASVSAVLLTRRLWMLVDIQSACWAPGSKILSAAPSTLAEAMIAQGSAVVSEFRWTPRPRPATSRAATVLSVACRLGYCGEPAASGSPDHRAAGGGARARYTPIPGSIHHPGAKGCHQLIRDGAVLVENHRAHSKTCGLAGPPARRRLRSIIRWRCCTRRPTPVKLLHCQWCINSKCWPADGAGTAAP